MEPWVVLVIVAVVVISCAGAQRLGWIDLSNKSRTSGRGGGMMGAVDEIFAPSRYEAQVENDRQTMLPAPAPIARDPHDPARSQVYDGRVRIDLD